MRKRKQIASLPVAAEICESRLLMAGSATASFAAGLLQVHVTGGGKVRIAETGPGTYKVAAIGSVLINGSSDPFLLSGLENVDVSMDPAKNATVENVVRIGTEGGLLTTVPGNVMVDEGGGYNRLYFENLHVGGNVAVERGSDDYCDLEQVTVSGTTNVDLPLGASQLVLQQSPTSGTPGQALSPSVKVAVEDAFGNVVTSDKSTVTIAVASGPGGFAAGSTTSVAAVSGVATFSNLILGLAGTYTLKATDGTLRASPREVSSSARWRAASQLAYQQTPSTGTAGTALSPSIKVAVEDSSGNVVTSDTSTVTITIASGPGSFAAGSTTSVAAVNGVATFSNLILDTAGTYTLKATDGTLASVTSGNIVVRLAPPLSITAPTNASVSENGSLVFSGANGNAVSVTDNAAGQNADSLTITVEHGTLTLGSTNGLIFVAGFNGTASFTVKGTMSQSRRGPQQSDLSTGRQLCRVRHAGPFAGRFGGRQVGFGERRGDGRSVILR